MRSEDVIRRIEAFYGYKTRQRSSHYRFETNYTDADGARVTAFTTVQKGGLPIPLRILQAIERDLVAAFGEGWLLW